MIKLRTRSYLQDYDYFSAGVINIDWVKKYESLRFDSVGCNILLEIDNEYFKAIIGRANGKRADCKGGRIIGYDIYVEGKINSNEAKFALALISYVFHNDANIPKKFSEIGCKLDGYFTEEFVNSLDGKRNTPETEKLVMEKLYTFYNEFLKNYFPSSNIGAEDVRFEKLCFDIARKENILLFKKKSRVIACNENTVQPGKISLVYTDSILEKKYCDEFVSKLDENYFATKKTDRRALIITSTNNENFSMPYEIPRKKIPHNPDERSEVMKMKIIAVLAILFLAAALSAILIYKNGGNSRKQIKKAQTQIEKLEADNNSLQMQVNELEIKLEEKDQEITNLQNKLNDIGNIANGQ